MDTPERWADKETVVALLPSLPAPEVEPPLKAPLVVSKECQRFAQFADVVRRDRYSATGSGSTDRTTKPA
jgi:hypothetical protein